MVRSHSILADALEALKKLQDSGVSAVIRGSEALGARNTKILVEAGFLEQVIRGWYIVTQPAHVGTTVSWYSSFWTFVAEYCNERFGDEWCLTPEESILVISGATVIPKQVLVRVRRGSNTVQQLLHGTSIFNITASIPDNRLRDAAYGLYHYPLAEALLRCSPDFFRINQMECRACLSALEPDQSLESAVRSVGGEAYAGRLIGALEAVGRTDAADFVRTILHDEGRRIEVSNPFEQPVEPVEARTSSPLAVRLRLMWAEMRKRVLSVASDKGMSPVPRAAEQVLADIDEGYVSDSYHSLSIEGYRVSEELIRRVRDGDWNPEANTQDGNSREALAASGYYRAYRKVRKSVEGILAGADAAETIAASIDDWHRELFAPHVDAGIVDRESLLGYRRSSVFIAGSRYTPPPACRVVDAMEAFLDLFRNEPDTIVRAVLGHFFLVHIHPYSDGNGRAARFVMNASFVSGGYAWKVVKVDSRDKYMSALETASVTGDITAFASFVLS